MAAQLDCLAAAGEDAARSGEAEIDNLRAAFTWSRENGEIESALAARVIPATAVAPRGRRGRLGWLDTALADETHRECRRAPGASRALADKALDAPRLSA